MKKSEMFQKFPDCFQISLSKPWITLKFLECFYFALAFKLSVINKVRPHKFLHILSFNILNFELSNFRFWILQFELATRTSHKLSEQFRCVSSKCVFIDIMFKWVLSVDNPHWRSSWCVIRIIYIINV